MCRDTLSFLSNSNHNIFTIRGSHPTVTPVDLPLWLPLKTLNGMVQLYRGRLLKELVKIIKTKHKRTISDMPSFQSDGGLSIASDGSSSQTVSRPERPPLYD
jgi:hypothetical protein